MKSIILFTLVCFLVNFANKVSSESIEIEKTSHSPILRSILEEHVGSILFPEDTSKFDYEDLKLGYTFKLKKMSTYRGGKKEWVDIYRLSRIADENYIFSYSHIPEKGMPQNRELIMWRKGFEHARGSENRDFREKKKDCKFVLGACKITTISGYTITVYTEFSDGVWYRIRIDHTGLKAHIQEVFDKHGFPLYQSKNAFGFTERYRVK